MYREYLKSLLHDVQELIFQKYLMVNTAISRKKWNVLRTCWEYCVPLGLILFLSLTVLVWVTKNICFAGLYVANICFSRRSFIYYTHLWCPIKLFLSENSIFDKIWSITKNVHFCCKLSKFSKGLQGRTINWNSD